MTERNIEGLKRSPLPKLIVAGFALLLAVTHQTRAETVNVDCTPAALRNAITAANATPEADTLDLAADCIYSFTSGDATHPDSALPRITSPITINGNGATISGNNSVQVFDVGAVAILHLNNVTVSQGSAEFGGGIYNLGGTVTVTNSTLSSNRAEYSGGAIYNNAGTLTVSNSTISGNSADGGSGIYAYDSNVTVTNSNIIDNSARHTVGIANYAGTLTVSNSTISGNKGHVNDGAMGGGLHNYGTLTVINSTISDNSAWVAGGLSNGGEATVINSTISGNASTLILLNFGGGGLFNLPSGTLTVINSTISGNSTVSSGGGIFNYEGALTMINSTLSGNSAAISGGGIINLNGTVTMSNSIVWGNNTQISGTVNVTSSIVEGGFGDSLSADPLFVAPISHTSAPTSDGDYRLLSGSPAINAGNNAALPADGQDLDSDGNIAEPVPFDRDGNPRIANTTVDLGAYEYAGGLLKNEDFEVDVDGNNVPDSWTMKNGSGDKRKCNTPDKLVAFAGSCAFVFKGGLGESAKLTQNVDLTGVTLSQGDALALSAYVNGGNAAVKGKLILKVSYVGEATAQKESVPVGPNAGYTLVTVPDLLLIGPDVGQIKVMLKHKSTTAKLFVDSASLILLRGSVRSLRSDILPPTPAPDGMRGFN